MNKLFLAVALLFLAGCSDNSAVTTDTQVDAESAEVAAPEAVVETMEVTADELLAAYKENELAGDQEYKGKTLVVTGVLDSIQSGIGDTPYLLLKAGDEFEFSMPQAHFDKSETDSLVTLKKGESIKIQCLGDGEMMGSPMLKDCKVV